MDLLKYNITTADVIKRGLHLKMTEKMLNSSEMHLFFKSFRHYNNIAKFDFDIDSLILSMVGMKEIDHLVNGIWIVMTRC